MYGKSGRWENSGMQVREEELQPLKMEGPVFESQRSYEDILAECNVGWDLGVQAREDFDQALIDAQMQEETLPSGPTVREVQGVVVSYGASSHWRAY